MGIDLSKYDNDSKYFRAADFGPTPRDFTTLAVEEHVIGREKKEPKLVLLFKETQQMLVLNKTNREMMVDHFTDDTDRWTGRRIRIRRIRSTYGSSPWSLIIEDVPEATSRRPTPEPEPDHDDEGPVEDWRSGNF